MKKNWKLATLALATTGMMLTTACTDDTIGDGGNGNIANNLLNADITEDVTLKAGETYTLDGGIHVKNGATLKIEPGVKIEAKHDNKVDYILVEQGAKIDAQGTASQPIVMTSEKKEAGAWGGLHICGYAPTNVGTGTSEIGDATYGGDKADDNSGVLRYVRMEYTGYAFSEDKESNGITFYGVGNGTTVDYVQAFMGSDDGFEFFGGSVNIRHAVVTDCSDDSFDWTEGWNGKGQYLVAYQGSKDEIGYDCDCLMECDNHSTNFEATPTSFPTLANVTLVGNGGEKQGVRLRAGTKVNLYNTIITGKGQCLTVETAPTENALKNGESKLNYVTIGSGFTSKENIYTQSDFLAAGNNNEVKDLAPVLESFYVGTAEGGLNMSTADSFFDAAEYRGAVPSDNDWTAGWTAASGSKPQEIEELKGTVTSDVTLAAGKTYYLTGDYTVKSPATLTIEEGVTIIAKHDNVVDYILVEQGAKINAVGTAENPIVMTSEKKEAGAWGGLHICGKAPINVQGGKGTSEIGDAAYGGDDAADNSGKLSYIRLEYTGYAFSEDKEANGVTFYGVGNGTSVDHLQAYRGSDDGFEFFGGTVCVKYMVATSCSDDSFDWTEGWCGKGQFMVAYQENEETLGYDCDCLMECDSNDKDNSLTPVSHPVLSNLTLVGNGNDGRGVRLRAGTEVELYNAIITGKEQPLTVETDNTENALKNGISRLNYVEISGVLSSKQNIYTNDLFEAAEGNKTNATFELEDKFIGTTDGGKDMSADSFFTATDYKGAVTADDNWTAGWTL